jgi:hypothetical protein
METVGVSPIANLPLVGKNKMATITAREVTLQDLGELCMRATIAFAARCARRVRPGMDELPDDFPDLDKALATIDAAIVAAETYAQARISRYADAEATAQAALQIAEAAYPYRRLGAYAAAHAAKAAAEAIRAGERANDAIAMEVLAGAYGANRVALTDGTGQRQDEPTASRIKAAIFADFEVLRKLAGGTFRDLGDPIDTSEGGPLGPLWPDPPASL